MYEACQKAYRVKHFLIDCINLGPTYQKYYKANNLKDLFELHIKLLKRSQGML